MNRPVLGTISILALLGAGFYFAWTYRNQPGPSVRRSYEEAAARSAIQAWLELPLPASAVDIHCMVEDLERTKLVYARFDIPTIDLPPLFDQPGNYPNYGELVPNPSLLEGMKALADPQRPWWQLDLPNPLCAQKSGKRNVAPAALKRRVQVCAAPLSASISRVFVAFSEEPVDEKQE
jgi:hypothetical protein